MILNSRQHKGFTLIELIIVIAILSILAAIAVPSLTGMTQRAKMSADLVVLSSLHKSTQVYMYIEDITQGDIFEGIDTNEDRIEHLKISGYLAGETEPKARGASFEWSIDRQVWLYNNTDFTENDSVDTIIETFKAAMSSGPLDFENYLGKDTKFKWGSGSKYSPDSWNGYLEKLLEAGDVESDRRDHSKEGSNTIGYINSFSTSEKKGTVLNLPNKGTLNSLYHSSPDYLPPAIMLTKESELAYDSSDPYLTENLEKLKGTMILYKSDQMSNKDVQIYYVMEDGSKSELFYLTDIFD